MSKPQRPRPACVYCDAGRATTRDHVVPKCLFDGQIPADAVTVPVCRLCNAAKAQDDTYLRDFLAIDEANFDHPVAQALFGGRMRRAVRHNRSEVARAVVTRTEIRPAYTPGGVLIG